MRNAVADHGDVLAGLMRLAAVRAAEALGDTVGSPVETTIPEARWVTPEACREEFALAADGPLVAVAESFDGPVSGTVALLVLESSSHALVHAILPDSAVADVLSESVEEVLAEFGNVWLNACIGVLAETCGGDFAASLPVLWRGDATDFLGTACRGCGEHAGVLLAGAHIAIRGRAFAGQLAFVVDGAALGALSREMPDERLSVA